VLPVVAFIVFWVLLGFFVFFIAVRGGPAGARQILQGQSPRARQLAGILFVIIYVGFGVALPIVFLRGNNANANAQVGGIRLTADEKKGRELFGLHCAVCHTLAAANANGKVGPNLDMLRPPESLVLHTINNGCLQKPPSSSSPESCLGQGVMPAQILQGKEAQQVAQFVARVAGKE
jgi:mono/diheme cytochrome c family protein